MPTEDEVFSGTWRPIRSVLKLLEPRMAFNDGAKWILENFSGHKYLNIRLDMRTGHCYVSPGNNHE